MNKKSLKKEKHAFEILYGELRKIHEEIKNDISGPVIASFGFIIALVWRDAIQGALDVYLTRAGLTENAYIYQVISATIVTIVVIIIIVFVTKWGRKKAKKRFAKELKQIQEESLDKLKTIKK